MNNTMSRILALFTLTSAVALAASPLVIVNPDTLKWQPAADLPGAEFAVMSGNPEKHEPFIARVKLPANFKIPVHTHHINEYDTVISGALYLGTGAKFDADHTQKISAGCFVMIPAKVKHYIFTKEETVLQVNGMGPWGMVYKKKVDS